MNPPLRDLGPLTWVMDELRRTLADTVAAVEQFVADADESRQSHLAEVDGSALRVVRQQLHQAAGALDMVELAAAARALRALEAAVQRLMQKPALATPDFAHGVRSGSHALTEYLDRILMGRSVHELALFPTYRDWQLLAGASRAHPADLWEQVHADVELPAGKVYEPGGAVRAHLDRLVLHVVKTLNPQAAWPLAQLSGGLARHATDPAVRRFWVAAAGCFEAVATGKLADDLYVKRAASSVLLQYSQLQHGDGQSLPGHTHDLLFLASQVRPDPDDPAQVYLRALWQAHGWADAPSWDPEARLLGAYDPAHLLALKSTVESVQQSWSVFTETDAVLPASVESALEPLTQRLQLFMPSWPAWGHLADAWSAVAHICRVHGGIPEGLALEASNSLLLLGAELDDFDALEAETQDRLHALAFRLQQVMDDQPVPEPEDWMTERYRRAGQQATLVQVVAQWQSELHAVEDTLDAFFRGPAAVPVPAVETIHRRLEAMAGIATLLDLPEARRAIEAVQVTLRPVDSDVVDLGGLQTTAQKLGANVTALGWMLDSFARQPEWARSHFVFDEAAGCLVSLAPEPAQTPSTPALTEGLTGPTETVVEDAVQPVAVVLPEPAAAEEDEDLLSIFLDEARGVFEGADTTLGILRQQADRLSELTALRRCFHTLKGSARMVGLDELGEAAWAMEQLLNAWLADQKHASAELLDLSEQALDYLQRWTTQLEAGQQTPGLPSPAPVRLSADALRLDNRYEPIRAAFEATAVPEPPLLEEVVDVPDDLPEVPVLEEAVKLIGPLKVGLELYNVFINEADEWSRRLGQGLSEWRLAMHEPLSEDLSVWAHSLAGGSATVGYMGLSQLARSLEHALDRAMTVGPDVEVTEAQADLWVSASDEIRELLHQFAAGFLREPNPDSMAALDAMAFRPRDLPSPPAISAPAPAVEPPVLAIRPVERAAAAAHDRLDADLLAVFLDEAHELMPKLSSAMRQWLAWPDNTTARAEILRNLHTLKGSSRLAGLLALGDQVHHLESATLSLAEVPPASDIAVLQTQLDAIVSALDALRRSLDQPEPRAHEARPAETDVQPEAGLDLLPPELVATSTGTVRVRAHLLDQLMSQTGDLLIARTRLENDVRALRQSFKDMSSNIDRMRAQLRDLELQTESQMQSRIAQSRETDPRFDPLEFDRYTRVQELTRLLAESVNDVATVQQSLNRSVESVEGNLASQTHLTRELQRDLLRTRLVAFDTIQERLQRLVRQSAESASKLAELTIDQQEVEVDRAVLEKLTPALEHLLRNAVVHGIETPAERQRQGKPESGQIRIALSVQANDLAITLSDDGAGLDVERIRQRAIALGLLPADAPFSVEDAGRLIFASGMSTATEVTEVAGRGIGLDVVRTEVLDLGGRIENREAAAGGTVFRLVVPLSTAVTQVVMLRVGELVFGVPSPWVEHVRRVRAPELTVAYQTGQWKNDFAEMPFYWAGGLLAQSPESTDTQGMDAKYWSVIEFAVAGQRVACHVDEVLGHQEIVVKAMGPQLSRLPGLTGATVLASGAVALIYNPVTLSVVYGQAARAWKADGGATMTPPSQRSATAETGLVAQAPLILVVDDSITVRRVTQRLLKREGYRVNLAADGVQALDQIAQELPLVVLCDIEMPRMDGFELVQHLRNEPETQNIPVVMITSRLAEKHWDHARSLGVDHYLGKPYAEEELLAIIDGHVRLAKPRS